MTTSVRPPMRPTWQILLTALVGFALPFAVVVWFGLGSNEVERVEWYATWEELFGVALGPVVRGEDWDRIPVRYQRRDGTWAEEPVVIAPLQPRQPDADSLRSVRAGERVPLVRDIDADHQVLVSPHFRAESIWSYIAAGTALGLINGALLAVVYRRRHRM